MSKSVSFLKIFIVLALMVNAIGMFFPSLSSTFTPYYGSIAKHIAETNNWTDLIFAGHDWLDKPHFPFWITALSFKIFGINTFAYVLPGYIFYIIGLIFTYKLAKYWFDNNTGLIACLMYVTSMHLLLSSIDVRAEAYLLGEIMPASYFWLKYNERFNLKNLIIAAIFTALAIMTKGIFVIITVISGIICLWIYKKKWGNFISLKWILGLAISLILITPEIIALYHQFDLHPEKIVFNQSHVSGIRWFFWDSQFGRFFNTGPIMSTNPPPFHYLFFIHTFLWAFLPWALIFFIALYSIFINFKHSLHKDAYVFLLGSFFITFIIFSITTFQVDHYINILLPYACIISAQLLLTCIPSVRTYISYIQISMSVILMIAIIILSPIMFNGVTLIIIELLAIVALIITFWLKKIDKLSYTLIIPTISILIVFTFVTLINGIEYAKYDAGYQIATLLNQTNSNKLIQGYKVDLLSLDFNAKAPYINIDSLRTLKKAPSYIVTTQNNETELTQYLPNSKIIANFEGSDIGSFVSGKFNKTAFKNNLKHYIVLEINSI